MSAGTPQAPIDGADAIDPGDLPWVLQRVAEIASMRAALAFAAEFGGRELYIPETLQDDHRLVTAVGRDAAEAVCREFGHGKLLVPLGPLAPAARQRHVICRMIREGRSLADIAAATGCHIRTVGKYRAKLRGRDDGQPDLFGD